MRYYYLYEITNKINNKNYIGVHTTSNLDDGYLGSGKALWAAIEKHGKHNFTKRILQFFSNQDEAYLAESEMVTIDFVKLETNYNIQPGGKGGFWQVDKKTAKRAGRLGGLKNRGIPKSAEHKLKISRKMTGYTYAKGRKKFLPKFIHTIKIPTGEIIETTNLKQYCIDAGLGSLRDFPRLNRKGYYLISKRKWSSKSIDE